MSILSLPQKAEPLIQCFIEKTTEKFKERVISIFMLGSLGLEQYSNTIACFASPNVQDELQEKREKLKLILLTVSL